MKAYISCPLDINHIRIDIVTAKLRELQYDVEYYIRGTTYNDSSLRESDIFILIPPVNQFDMEEIHLTPGCAKELRLALDLGKKLYLAYWKNNYTSVNIYELNTKLLIENNRVIGKSKHYLQPYSKPVIINSYQIY